MQQSRLSGFEQNVDAFTPEKRNKKTKKGETTNAPTAEETAEKIAVARLGPEIAGRMAHSDKMWLASFWRSHGRVPNNIEDCENAVKVMQEQYRNDNTTTGQRQ